MREVNSLNKSDYFSRLSNFFVEARHWKALIEYRWNR